jgi:bacterioferritin-associated ferredoxin
MCAPVSFDFYMDWTCHCSAAATAQLNGSIASHPPDRRELCSAITATSCCACCTTSWPQVLEELPNPSKHVAKVSKPIDALHQA